MASEVALDSTNSGAGEPRASVLLDDSLLPKRFLVVSNRLPYQISVQDDQLTLRRGMGGLVTALDPVLRTTGGTWIGWTGNYGRVPRRIAVKQEQGAAKDYNLRTIDLSRREVEQFYLGYSNKGLWPLYHYFQEHCEFNHEHWKAYEEINRRFADSIIYEYRPGDLIWIHDYHLMLVPAMVRRAIPDAKIGFFLHIPFPAAEVFQIDPHADELLSGVLGSDLVGFHIDVYARNFINAVASMTDRRCNRDDMEVFGDGRRIKVGTLPISIDYDRFADLAARESTTEKVGEIRDYYRAETIAIGVDRLDYSKGILERLRAIEIMLDRHPELQGKFSFVQISAPSRTKVHAYQEMRERIEQMVGHVNGRFGGRGCIPIDYRYEGHPQEDLVAFYRASGLALVTPLRDGMNLVAKEYVASKTDDSGALVLSRFAGAFEELEGAVIVNPYDPETTAERIYQALVMPTEEKQRRMRRMREIVRHNDIYRWLERFLKGFPDSSSES